jgi:glycerophosphoryl diester phosphodiesterase
VSLQVIAHRTCANHVAENSLAGIAVAAELGADAVELDVRLARDGTPVLLHDPLPWRTTWPPLPVPVRLLPRRVVTGLRLRRGEGERVPTLASALAALPAGLGVAIDTKDPRAAPAVLAAVRVAGVSGRALLWSQHEAAVRHYAAEAPEATISLLRDVFDPDAVERLLRDAVAFGATAVSVPDETATSEFVALATARSLDVYAWCRTYAAQRDGVAPGVRAIVTEWISEARALLAPSAPG